MGEAVSLVEFELAVLHAFAGFKVVDEDGVGTGGRVLQDPKQLIVSPDPCGIGVVAVQ